MDDQTLLLLTSRNALGKINNDNQAMLELEALDETTKEDSRLSEAREQIVKLESEIKKFSLYFLSLESNKKSPKPKIEIRGLMESFDEKYTSDADNNEDFNIELEKENEFNLFTPIKLTPDLNEKKNKDGAFSRDNRIIKKPRLDLSPESSPYMIRDFSETFDNNKLLEVESELARVREEYELEKSRFEENIRQLLEDHNNDLNAKMEKDADLVSRITELETENKHLNNEMNTKMENDGKLANQITELEAENKSLKENHSENVEVEKELARIREEYELEKSRLEENIKQLQENHNNDLNNAKMENDVELVNQITELEAENKSLKENHSEIVEVEKELTRIREEYELEKLKLEDSIKQLEENLYREMEQEVNLVNQLTELETENKSLKENHGENVEFEKELARAREEYELEKSRLEENIRQLQEDHSNDLNELNTKVEQEAKLFNQITELEAENKSLKENHNENAEIVEELSRVRVEFELEKSRLEENAKQLQETLHSEMSAKMENEAKLFNQMSELESEKKELARVCEEREFEKSGLEDKIKLLEENLNHEMDTKTENDAKLTNQITELEAENKSLKENLNDTAEVEKELARVQVEFELERSRLEENIRQLLEDHNNDLNAKMEKDADLVSRITELETENKYLKESHGENEFFKIVAELDEVKLELEKKSSANEELCTKLKEKSNELQLYIEEKKSILRDTDYRLSSVTNLNLEIEEKNCEIKLLESQLMGLNDNVKLINKSYTTTREEKDKLTDSLQLAQEEISELHEKVRRGSDNQHVLEDKVTELESKLESSNQTQQKLEKDLEIIESKNLELKQDLQSTKLEASSQISHLNEELEKYKTTITFLEQDREELIAENQSEIDSLQNTLQTSEEQFKSTVDEKDTLIKELELKGAQIAEQLTQKSEEFENLEGAFHDAEGDIAILNDRIQEITAESNQNVSKLETEISNFNDLVEKLRLDLDSKDELVNVASEKIEKLSTLLEENGNVLNSRDQEIANLKLVIESMSEENSDSNNQLTEKLLSLSNQNSELESLIAKLNESIESLNLNNSNQIVVLNDKNEEIKFLQEQRKQIDEDISELEKELVSAQASLEMAKSAEVSFTKSVTELNQRLEEKDEYIKDLEEKRNEVDRLFEEQEKESQQSQQLVLTMLRNDTDEILVEGKGEYIEEVKKEIQNLHSKGLSVNAKYLDEQAENIRYLQSQREENDQLFVAQQQEIEELERKLHESELIREKCQSMEKEILSLKQNLSEAQSIIKQNIDKPITEDERDISITDLRAKVDQLTQENIELSQKVSKYHTQRNVILKQMKAMSENPPKIAKENSNNTNQGKPTGTRSVSFK